MRKLCEKEATFVFELLYLLIKLVIKRGQFCADSLQTSKTRAFYSGTHSAATTGSIFKLEPP